LALTLLGASSGTIKIMFKNSAGKIRDKFTSFFGLDFNTVRVDASSLVVVSCYLNFVILPSDELLDQIIPLRFIGYISVGPRAVDVSKKPVSDHVAHENAVVVLFQWWLPLDYYLRRGTR
jgi:hypothetical protein